MDFKTVCQVISLLTEGVSVRAVSRLTGIHIQTVLNCLELAGKKCVALLQERVRNLAVKHVEIDEAWSYVGCKQQNTEITDMLRGDQYVYLAIDATSKLILAYHIGKRDRDNANAFLSNVRNVVAGQFQLSSDGFNGYRGFRGAVRQTFGHFIDYATEIKFFAAIGEGPRRYNPMVCKSVQRNAEIGEPDLNITTTNHAERNNLSVRLFNKRYARLTMSYSKKLENHWLATALHIAHFNFCRVHSAHKKTPAQAAGLTNHRWAIAELISSEVVE